MVISFSLHYTNLLSKKMLASVDGSHYYYLQFGKFDSCTCIIFAHLFSILSYHFKFKKERNVFLEIQM